MIAACQFAGKSGQITGLAGTPVLYNQYPEHFSAYVTLRLITKSEIMNFLQLFESGFQFQYSPQTQRMWLITERVVEKPGYVLLKNRVEKGNKTSWWIFVADHTCMFSPISISE